MGSSSDSGKLRYTAEETAARRLRGSRAIKQPKLSQKHFDPAPDMPRVRCRNADKASYADTCDEFCENGFTICGGCKTRSNA